MSRRSDRFVLPAVGGTQGAPPCRAVPALLDCSIYLFQALEDFEKVPILGDIFFACAAIWYHVVESGSDFQVGYSVGMLFCA